MIEVVGVQFISGLKVYDFKPGDNEIAIKDYVLVETAKGEEIGRIVYVGKEIKEDDAKSPLKEISRVLSEGDKGKLKEYRKKGAKMFPEFQKKIIKYKLDMKPTMIDFTLDGETAIFYFTAEGRVDFRGLARDLSRTFRIQVKMRQIGSRDEAKIYGGYGMCGRPVCCKRFLVSSEAITMDMVRKQYSSGVATSKVSGLCGRLMCCLAFEKKKGDKNK